MGFSLFKNMKMYGERVYLALPVANGKSRFLHRVTFELIISKRLKAQFNYHFTLVEVFEIVKQKKNPLKQTHRY